MGNNWQQPQPLGFNSQLNQAQRPLIRAEWRRKISFAYIAANVPTGKELMYLDLSPDMPFRKIYFEGQPRNGATYRASYDLIFSLNDIETLTIPIVYDNSGSSNFGDDSGTQLQNAVASVTAGGSGDDSLSMFLPSFTSTLYYNPMNYFVDADKVSLRCNWFLAGSFPVVLFLACKSQMAR